MGDEQRANNEELVAAIQAGNELLYTQLWEQIERFVSQQAGRAAGRLKDYPLADFEDLFQSGYLAMVQAVQTYNPDKNVLFLTWFGYYLKSAFATVGGYRSEKDKRSPLRYVRSLDAPLSDTEGLTLADTIQDPTDRFEDTEYGLWQEQLHTELDKALGTLPQEQRKTIRERFYHGHTLGQTGDILGATPEQVRGYEGKALRALRHPKVSASLKAFLDENTNFYLTVGVDNYQRTGTSSVERAVFHREALNPERTPREYPRV